MDTTEQQHSGPVRASSLVTLSKAHLKNDLTAALGSLSPVQRALIPELVDALVSTLIEALCARKSVRLRRIGCLAVFDKEERNGGRNFRSGEPQVIPGRTTVTLRLRNDETAFEVGTTDLERAMHEKVPDANKQTVHMFFVAFLQQLKKVAQGTVRFELRGLGVFLPSFREEKMVRDPRTGQRSLQPAHYAIRFRAGKRLIQKLNNKFD